MPLENAQAESPIVTTYLHLTRELHIEAAVALRLLEMEPVKPTSDDLAAIAAHLRVLEAI